MSGDSHWENQPRAEDGKWTDGGGGSGGGGGPRALARTEKFVRPERNQGEGDNAYRARVSRARQSFRREQAATATTVTERQVPNPRHAEKKQALTDAITAKRTATEGGLRARIRGNGIEQMIQAKTEIKEGRARRRDELQGQLSTLNDRIANAERGGLETAGLRRLRDTLTRDANAVSGTTNQSVTALRELEVMHRSTDTEANRNFTAASRKFDRVAALRRALGDTPATITERVETRVDPEALENLPQRTRTARQGHFTRNLNALRTAAGKPPVSADEARQLFEAHYREHKDVRPRNAAGRPDVPAPAPAPARSSGVPTVHGVKLKLEDRTPEKLAEVHATNSRILGQRTADGLQRMFTNRTPTAPELNAGYSTKEHKAEMRVSAYGSEVAVSGTITHSVTGEHVNETLDRTYYRDRDGVLAVRHACFRVKPEYQATGIGREILSNSVRMNHEMGVRRITVGPLGSAPHDTYEHWERNQGKLKETKSKLSNVLKRMKEHKGTNHAEFIRAENEFIQLKDEARSRTQQWNGPFVWATMGFKWSQDSGNEIGDGFAAYLTRNHGVPREKAKQMADRVKHTPQDLARAEHNGKKVGAHYLQSYVQGSPVTMEIKRDNPAWQHMKKHLGLEDLDP